MRAESIGGAKSATLADALSEYAHICTVSKKGAYSEVGRINRYLAGARRPLLRLITNANGAYELQTATDKKLKEVFAKHRDSRLQQRQQTYAQISRLATMRCADIKTSDIRRLKVAMEAEGLSDSTVQKEIALLKVVFRTARDEWGWEGFINPCSAIKLGKSCRRFVHLSSAEEDALARAIAECDNPYIEPLVFIARETTLRRGTLLSIRWSDIDIEHRAMLLPTKTGQRKYVFTEVVRDIFQQLKDSLTTNKSDDRVFPMSLNALTCAWKRLRERAGLQSLHFKDLRHLGATNWVRRGLGTHELKAVLGHSSIATAQFYVDLVGEDQLAAIDRAMSNVPALRLPHVAKDTRKSMSHSRAARLNARHCLPEMVDSGLPSAAFEPQTLPAAPIATSFDFPPVATVGYRLPNTVMPPLSYTLPPRPPH